MKPLQVLVPARQASRRLPLKHLYPLWGKMNALDMVMERVWLREIPTRLFVGSGDFLYEELGKTLGYDDVIRTNSVADGDLLHTLWEGSIGFERTVVVYGDSPLINAELVRDLIDWTGDKEFGWVDGIPGLRPFMFTRDFLMEWLGKWNREKAAPFSLHRWPGVYPEAMELVGAREWSLDSKDDLRRLQEFFSAEGPRVSLKRILECSQ